MSTATTQPRASAHKRQVRNGGFLLWFIMALSLHFEWVEVLVSFAALIGVPCVWAWRDSKAGVWRSVWRLACGGFVVMSFLFEAGPIAGLCASGWLIECVRFASGECLAGLRTLQRRDRCWAAIANLLRAVTASYLVVGAFWLCAVRSGWSPFGFPIGISLLTATHFHFGGFLLPSAGIKLSEETASRPLRFAVASILVAFPIVAIGMMRWPFIELGGVVWLLAAVELFAFEQLRSTWSDPTCRRCLRLLALVALLSSTAAAGMAGIYAWAEFHDVILIPIPRMIVWHGTMNAIGLVGSSLAIAMRTCARDLTESAGTR